MFAIKNPEVVSQFSNRNPCDLIGEWRSLRSSGLLVIFGDAFSIKDSGFLVLGDPDSGKSTLVQGVVREVQGARILRTDNPTLAFADDGMGVIATSKQCEYGDPAYDSPYGFSELLAGTAEILPMEMIILLEDRASERMRDSFCKVGSERVVELLASDASLNASDEAELARELRGPLQGIPCYIVGWHDSGSDRVKTTCTIIEAESVARAQQKNAGDSQARPRF